MMIKLILLIITCSVAGFKFSQFMAERGWETIMSWSDWYMLENAASTEKIIANWLFLVAAIFFSRLLVGWAQKNGFIKE